MPKATHYWHRRPNKRNCAMVTSLQMTRKTIASPKGNALASVNNLNFGRTRSTPCMRFPSDYFFARLQTSPLTGTYIYISDEHCSMRILYDSLARRLSYQWVKLWLMPHDLPIVLLCFRHGMGSSTTSPGLFSGLENDTERLQVESCLTISMFHHVYKFKNWLVVWNRGILWLSIHLGMSWSQLTIRPSFFRGVGSTTN